MPRHEAVATHPILQCFALRREGVTTPHRVARFFRVAEHARPCNTGYPAGPRSTARALRLRLDARQPLGAAPIPRRTVGWTRLGGAVLPDAPLA